jgi:putative sigma-54 modulation protein
VNLILKGRGVQLNDQLRGYATEKLTRVQRFFERIIKMEIELRSESTQSVADRHHADVTVKTPGETLVAHGAGVDLFAAIDQAADKLEIQVKKHKDRLNHHHDHRARAELAALEARAAEDDGDLDGGPDIIRFPQQLVKPMAPEEAALELDMRGLRFLLFTLSDTMRAAVIYRRDDGGLGLIEHQG